jgi:hypothetical protein
MRGITRSIIFEHTDGIWRSRDMQECGAGDADHSPIAIAGNTVLVPAGDIGGDPGHPQLVAYTVPAH